MRRAARVLAAIAGAAVLSGHIGSPNVFFSGKAGPYDVRVVVRPPEVVPGVARVTVRTLEDVRRVSIRPVYWRAGSRGAPSADETRPLDGEARTFEGSLWLMQRGAYTVDVIVDGAQGTANVLVPVASVATGRLELRGGLAILLLVLGGLLCAGLVTIVYKGAGESLLAEGAAMDQPRRRRARFAAAAGGAVITIALLGGAKWWEAVDREYSENIYRPSPLLLSRDTSLLRIQLSDTVWQPGRTISALVPDHGKMMHLFLVRRDDARGFAHLHPVAADSGVVPVFFTRIPALPQGDYHVFGDVVHETGFERTLVGSITLPSALPAARLSDRDDAWYAGDAAQNMVARLGDGSSMTVALGPDGSPTAGQELTIGVTVADADGRVTPLESYLGMVAHAVIVKLDGTVYVHLHPMGSASTAAQQVFQARDRGDTTETGRVRLGDHAMHAPPRESLAGTVEFPYAFPSEGSYRLFVQVKRNGRIMTGAFAIRVTPPAQER